MLSLLIGTIAVISPSGHVGLLLHLCDSKYTSHSSGIGSFSWHFQVLQQRWVMFELLGFLGIFTKPFALMIRLFANISAGHIIILSLISLIFIAQDSLGNGGAWGVAPVSVLFVLFISLIEILVAFLQAYIFTLLSAVFIGMAVVEEH